jgi:hypothetical protein
MPFKPAGAQFRQNNQLLILGVALGMRVVQVYMAIWGYEP